MENPAPTDTTWQVSKVPPGSTLDRGMSGEKRTDDRSCKGGTLNSGGPESAPSEAARQPRDDCDQRQEDAVMTLRESDPPIVVRDGNTGHRAKERAGKQRKHRYLHGTRILPIKVSNSLLAMGIGSGTMCQRWFRVRAFLRSPVQEIRTPGTARGAPGNRCPYLNRRINTQ